MPRNLNPLVMEKNPRFVICLKNEGVGDLQPRKVYQVFLDEAAAQDGYLRVIDDSGEDYLYPDSYFLPVTLPRQTARAVFATPVA